MAERGGCDPLGGPSGVARVGFVGGIGRKREKDGRGKEQDHSGASRFVGAE